MSSNKPNRTPLKITTRITLYNVSFFTFIIVLMILFEFFLTQHFLFLRNRDELYVKREQLDDYVATHYQEIEQVPSSERLSYIYNQIQSLYLFDHYKYIAFIYNTEDESSYAFEKSYYDKLFLSNFNIVTNNLVFSYALEDSDQTSWMTFNISEPNDEDENNLVATAIIPLPTTTEDRTINQISFLGDTILETTLMVPFENEPPIYLTLFLFPQYDRVFIFILLTALLASSVVGILLMILFGGPLTRRALRPLTSLSSRANAIDYDTLDSRIPLTGAKDEIDSLITSLNVMLNNIEKSFDNQRRFISDASHELRIPLTVMKGYTELLEKTKGKDESLLEESIQSISAEVTSMQHLVEQLLLLARAESQRMPITLASFEVDSLMEQLKIESEHLYPGFHIEFDIEKALMINADYGLMLQILRALIDNAHKYALTDKGVMIKASSIPDKPKKSLEIIVQDFGKGIPEAALEHLTDRFYRVLEHRNREDGGFGLGLAIVDALVKYQNGTMMIKSIENTGTTIHLYMPTA